LEMLTLISRVSKYTGHIFERCVDVGQHDANCQADEKPDPGTNGVVQGTDGRTAIAVLYAEYQHRLEG
jgi:hypothetical protein